MRAGGFLLDQGWPLFISEFGADERGTNANDNNFLNCFFGLAAERDLDWALWALQGSYYLRGKIGTDEAYGLLDSSWGQLRNASFLQRLSTNQPPSQDHTNLFSTQQQACMVRKSLFEPLKLGPSDQTEGWSYTTQKT